jgi:hypothetical protein
MSIDHGRQYVQARGTTNMLSTSTTSVSASSVGRACCDALNRRPIFVGDGRQASKHGFTRISAQTQPTTGFCANNTSFSARGQGSCRNSASGPLISRVLDSTSDVLIKPPCRSCRRSRNIASSASNGGLCLQIAQAATCPAVPCRWETWRAKLEVAPEGATPIFTTETGPA